MKRQNSGLPTFVYILLGMLVISGFMLTISKRAGNTEPSVGSYGVSGLRLLSELLRDEGYVVTATVDPTPKLDPKRDVVVAVSTDVYGSVSRAPEEQKKGTIWQSLEEFEKDGGRSVYAYIGPDFQAITRAAREETLETTYSETPPHVVGNAGDSWQPSWLGSEPDSTTVYQSGQEPWASFVTTAEKQKRLFFADFSGATNRFIDRADNASVYVSLIRAFAPQGAHLVFVEAAWGNVSEPGFFESIGAWAEAGWTQLLLLGLVIVYTLGKPFGLPDATRARQRGQRELVDAYASTLRRAGATDIALSAVLADADRRLRRALKIDMGLDREQRDKSLPPILVDLMDRVRMAISNRAPVDIAMGLAERLDAEVTTFTGDRRPKARRRTKS